MSEYLIKLLIDLGVQVEMRQPEYEPSDTERMHEKLPPVILARTGEDKGKKTVLVYGMHLGYIDISEESFWLCVSMFGDDPVQHANRCFAIHRPLRCSTCAKLGRMGYRSFHTSEEGGCAIR